MANLSIFGILVRDWSGLLLSSSVLLFGAPVKMRDKPRYTLIIKLPNPIIAAHINAVKRPIIQNTNTVSKNPLVSLGAAFVLVSSDSFLMPSKAALIMPPKSL